MLGASELRSYLYSGGTIYNKSVQLLAYADDLNLIGRTIEAIEENFLALEIAFKRMGLEVNTEKTKFMATDCRNRGNSILIGEHNIGVTNRDVV